MNDPSKYMNDGSYLKINYSNAANGSKCMVQSKWEQGLLMKHNENYSPYNNSRTV